MKKRVIVISLGGSLLVPDKIDYDFISDFKKRILKLKRKYKFVIVVGGGKTARIYIEGLKDFSERIKCMMGIGITRMNARFMMIFFGMSAKQKMPKSTKQVEYSLRKDDVVFVGGLRYEPKNTSDGTAAQIASILRGDFINLTNVDGLYSKDPRKYKDAKFIPRISWQEFDKIVKKIKYKAGQHFVLDQHASEIIRKKFIRTVILNGNNLKNFEDYLEGKKFKGTVIYG
jgi:uridylate kinase